MDKENENPEETKIRENLLSTTPDGIERYKEEQERRKITQAIGSSIEAIEKEKEEVEKTIKSTLSKVVSKLSSVGIDILSCTALDIEGLSLNQEISTLRACHALKESNERAILRLRTSKLSEEFLAGQDRISKQLSHLIEWTDKTKKSIDELEQSIVERTTLSEVFTGNYILDRYENFLREIEPVEYILETACTITQKHTDIFTKKEKTDFILSESFIKISSQEERTLNHLLSIRTN